MLFKNAAFGDERAYMTVKNVSGATLTTGLGAAINPTNASFDGTQAVIANSGTLGRGFVGVATYDIPNNAYGAVQCFGPVASVLLSNVGSSITINVGDPLVPAPGGFFSANPLFNNSGFKYILASNTPPAVSASAYLSGYIRAI